MPPQMDVVNFDPAITKEVSYKYDFQIWFLVYTFKFNMLQLTFSMLEMMVIFIPIIMFNKFSWNEIEILVNTHKMLG
jgi:hypothetical protein